MKKFTVNFLFHALNNYNYLFLQKGDEKENKFVFDRVFPPSASQQEIYETAAKPVIESNQ